MKKLVVSLVSATALATVGMAAAANSMAASTNNGAGVFVSGNLGYGTSGFSKSYYQNQIFTGQSVTSYRDGYFAWAANLGYQFNQYLALEAGYISFGQSKATSNLSTTVKDSFAGFDAALKGILPITSQFDLFGKAGAVDMRDSVKITGNAPTVTGHSSKWTPLVALGTSYNVNKNVALDLQDDYAFKNGSSMPSANAILAGVSYKFNL